MTRCVWGCLAPRTRRPSELFDPWSELSFSFMSGRERMSESVPPPSFLDGLGKKARQIGCCVYCVDRGMQIRVILAGRSVRRAERNAPVVGDGITHCWQNSRLHSNPLGRARRGCFIRLSHVSISHVGQASVASRPNRRVSSRREITGSNRCWRPMSPCHRFLPIHQHSDLSA